MKLSELINQLNILANELGEDAEVRLLADAMGTTGQLRLDSVMEDNCEEEGMEVVTFIPSPVG